MITYYNVTEFGATGGGVISDTRAVQSAVDECSEAGGGVVLFPAGKYMLGKVFLKSNVSVQLQNGVHIIASANQEEYPISAGPKDTLLKYNPDITNWELDRRWAVFYGCDIENVVISGEGVIDGHYKDFLKPRKLAAAPSWSLHEKDLELYGRNGFRPVLIMLENCTNVQIKDISLINAPCYTMDFKMCSHMKISSIRIDNAIGADNSDGMHLSSCSDVIISQCDLHCGDDAIAIDTDEGKPSERIVVTSCILASRNNCLRIFHSLHSAEMYAKLPYCTVRDIVVSACVIRQGDCAVCINADKGEISNVQVTGITGTMTRNGAAFLITSHNNSRVESVTFSDWQLTCRGGGYMYAEPESVITDVNLRHIDLVICPKTQLYCCGLSKLKKIAEGVNKDMPYYWWSHHLPFFMQIVSVESIFLSGIKIRWGEEEITDLEDMESEEGRKRLDFLENEANYTKFNKPTRDWPAIRLDDVNNLVVDGAMSLIPHGKCTEAFVRYKNGKKINM